jgi:hypothetical protein
LNDHGGRARALEVWRQYFVWAEGVPKTAASGLELVALGSLLEDLARFE